jgi:hypothetical protein
MEKGKESVKQLVITAEKIENPMLDMDTQGQATETRTNVTGSMQSEQQIIETASVFTSPNELDLAFGNTAFANVGDVFTPVSNSPYNQALPSLESNNRSFLIEQRNRGQV